jgi:hypothetical protein
MADEIKDAAQFESTLTAEQKQFFGTYLPTVKTAAIEEHKTAAETERKKKVPETYGFKFKDESLFDPKTDREKIAAFARSRDLSDEDAQQFVDIVNDAVSGLSARTKATAAETVKAWETETWSDKELGGNNRSVTEQNKERALVKFGTSDLRKFLNDTGLGNNIHVIRLLNDIGRTMQEDNTPAGRSSNRKETVGPGERAYGHLVKK